MTSSLVHGGKFSIPADPPSRTARPWYSYTLEVRSSSPGVVTHKLLWESMVDAVGITLNESQPMECRYHSIRVWGQQSPTAGTGDRLEVLVHDLILPAGRETLATLTDWGTTTNRARVAYRWPASQFYQAITDQSLAVFSVFGDNWLAYVKMLWRSPQSNPTASGLPILQKKDLQVDTLSTSFELLTTNAAPKH